MIAIGAYLYYEHRAPSAQGMVDCINGLSNLKSADYCVEIAKFDDDKMPYAAFLKYKFDDNWQRTPMHRICQNQGYRQPS